ncbi:hypothetical protein HQ393_01415 [Chitinibacter bivalviorum]|uniref:Glycosyl transferase family 1 domain-containing protein n=1 Tax=Chitinibacter bivalviorum TaxID=2739434 RepID=A0A7H9BEL6_9NEIS|nr:glycosyltransferase [Chitinibacter bivalviorum]QLG87005.1 hypothetical protein HQ393_01415 [Chitinibacter bivalviorum]
MEKSVIINASNLNVGGGAQYAASIINEIVNSSSSSVSAIIVSSAVNQQVKIPKNWEGRVIEVPISPNRVMAFQSRKKIQEIIDAYSPDVFVTIFGPTYWRPKNVIHLVGFAQGWLIYDNSAALKLMPFWMALKRRLLNILQKKSFVRNSDYFFTETIDSANRLSEKFKVSPCKISVVENTASEYFRIKEMDDSKVIAKNIPREVGDVILLTVAVPYPHKNLSIINDLVRLLPCNYKFVVTVSSADYDRIFNRNDGRIINIGPVKNSECPSIYDQCDGVFLPSLIECFSCNYPEAFASKKIILTSKLGFATGVCKEAAFYFNPLDARDVASTIERAFLDSALMKEKIDIGFDILHQLPTPTERMEKLIAVALRCTISSVA